MAKQKNTPQPAEPDLQAVTAGGSYTVNPDTGAIERVDTETVNTAGQTGDTEE